MDDKKIPFCSRVVYWGQEGPLCWFNAILMAVLYSQRSRQVLLQHCDEWDMNNKVLKVFKHILKHKYIKSKEPTKDFKFFESISAPKVLKLLYNIKPKYLPEFFKDEMNGYLPELYISKLYKILGIDNIMFHVFKSSNMPSYNGELSYDKRNHIKNLRVVPNPNKLLKQKMKIDYDIDSKSKEYIENKINKNKNPSVIIVNADVQFHSREYKLNITDDNKDLVSLKDVIMYNGEEYVLDSILLTNWNDVAIQSAHKITGLTCNNERYVYNGWTKTTQDPAMLQNNSQKKINQYRQRPCELMKFPWNTSNGNDFCLNTAKCNLDKPRKNGKQLCFSFSKGDRNLIYVKRSISETEPLKGFSRTPDYRSFNSALSMKKQSDNRKAVSSESGILKSRYQIYKRFNKFKQNKSAKSMDELCSNSGNDFNLQVQQEFLKEYVQTYKKWKSLLLYHEIGSGKTCTVITIAEEFLKQDTKNKVTVILPARLKTNFIDGLISPCGYQHYISNQDFALYNAASTPLKTKQRIQKEFMAKINESYTIMSFEGFRKKMLDHKDDIVEYIKEYVKNNMIIIDEVHNIFSTSYVPAIYNKIVANGKINKSTKGLNAILMNLMSQNADNTSKFVYLTATPIFDNIGQINELVRIMSPEANVDHKKKSLRELIEHLRGKVSYFPGISKNAYPNVVYKFHEIKITEYQDMLISVIREKAKVKRAEEANEESEAFMIKQRLAELSCYPNSHKITKEQLNDLHLYAPKLKALVENLNKSIGKQVVYTNFVKRSINFIENILKLTGWFNLFDVIKHINDEEEWKKYEGRVYAVWSGNTKDNQKHIIKSMVNAKNNIFGKFIRVVLGSPSIKEGVSFYHVQDMHIVDPVWNMSAKNQVEGRVIRYCSHADIDEKVHKGLKRQVTINIYKAMPRPGGAVDETADQRIYDTIIPKKFAFVLQGENTLKNVSMDYHLFKKMYRKKDTRTPVSPKSAWKKSALDFDEGDVVKPKIEKKEKLTKCPKKRRPIKGLCPNGYFKKDNKDGFPCCYKERRPKKEKDDDKCPKPRRPVNGECATGYFLKNNKQGKPCCYKQRKGFKYGKRVKKEKKST
jgi:hypothetical protein